MGDDGTNCASQVIGSQIDARFDGTVTPLSVAFLVGAVLSGLAVRHALRVTRPTS